MRPHVVFCISLVVGFAAYWRWNQRAPKKKSLDRPGMTHHHSTYSTKGAGPYL